MKNSKKIIGGLIAIIIIVIIIIAIAINSGMIEKTPAAIKKTVVGEVYGNKITVEQVEQTPQMQATYKSLSQQIQGNLMDNAQAKAYIIKARGETVQSLEIQAIVDKKVKELKLIPTQADMDKLVNEEKQKFFAQIKEENGIDVNEQMYLQMTGMTQAEFNNMINQEVEVQAVSNYITKDIKVTDNDAQVYYNENKDTQFTKPATADVYQIVVGSKADAEKLRTQYESEINGKNLTVAQKLAIFQKIASANNIDSTKETGGLLQKNLPYNYSDFNKNFMTALQGLKQNGDISGIVDSSTSSQQAYNIIFIDNYKPSAVEPFDQVKEEAMKSIQSQKNNQAISETLAKWEKEANIKTYTDKLNYPILDSTSTTKEGTEQSGATQQKQPDATQKQPSTTQTQPSTTQTK